MALGQNPAFALSAVTTIAATSTSAGAALAGAGDTAIVTNAGTIMGWITFGGGSTPPTAIAGACYAVPAGAQRAVTCGALSTQVAAVLSASGTGSVYIERGSGAAR